MDNENELRKHLEVFSNTGLLPADLKIPDINVPEGREPNIQTFDFPCVCRGVNYKVVVELERPNSERSPKLLERTNINLLDEKGNQVAHFESVLRNDKAWVDAGGIKRSWDQIHKYVVSLTRDVKKERRKKGLGELGVKMTEELAMKLADKYPELKPKWFQINTGLASVAKLIVDQNWLKQHNLEEFSSSERNLGYIPFEDDEPEVEKLLRSGTEDILDDRWSQIRSIRFVKKVD